MVETGVGIFKTKKLTTRLYSFAAKNKQNTTFRQLYKRGYFNFKTDTASHIINFKKGKQDRTMFTGTILSLHYQIPDSNTIQLWGKRKNDSLYVLLKKSNQHFQLDEKQFHWLTDYPR